MGHSADRLCSAFGIIREAQVSKLEKKKNFLVSNYLIYIVYHQAALKVSKFDNS